MRINTTRGKNTTRMYNVHNSVRVYGIKFICQKIASGYPACVVIPSRRRIQRIYICVLYVYSVRTPTTTVREYHDESEISFFAYIIIFYT